MSQRSKPVVDRDVSDDYEDRKTVRANRRKDHRKLDRPSGDKRIKRVGASNERWKFDPRHIGDEDEFEDESDPDTL